MKTIITLHCIYGLPYYQQARAWSKTFGEGLPLPDKLAITTVSAEYPLVFLRARGSKLALGAEGSTLSCTYVGRVHNRECMDGDAIALRRLGFSEVYEEDLPVLS